MNVPLFGQLLIQAALGAVATIGFAIWFNLPRETLLRAAAVGAGGYVIRFGALQAGQPPFVASFLAAFFIGIAGYFRAKSFRYPRVIFTVTGIIPLVPGIPTYQALVYFSKGNVTLGLDSLLRATLIIASLSAGLTVARAITMLPPRGKAQ